MNNSSRDKGGFTLVELTIAIALVAILAAMIASFSVLMSNFAKSSTTEYTFLDDSSALKDKLTEWMAEEDSEGSVFLIKDGSLTANGEDVVFKNGELLFSEKKASGLGAVDRITFSASEDGKLIKCNVYKITESDKELESSFVFSLRCATVTEEAESDK